MGESSAFVSILVRSFSQNWGMIEDFSKISTALFLSVSEMSFLGLKKKVWSVIPPAGKKEPKQSFWLKALWAMIFSRSSFYSFAMPLLMLLIVLLLYLLSGFSYCSCSTLVIILLMMMSWIWLDGDHSLHFHFVTNSHVERLVAHSRLFDSKWELF